METARTDTEQAARAITGRPIPQLLAQASSIALSSGRDRRSGRSDDPLSRDAWSGLMWRRPNPHDYRNAITKNACGNCNFELALRGGYNGANTSPLLKFILAKVDDLRSLGEFSALPLRARKRNILLGAKNVAVEIGDPLASARRLVEITYFSLNVRRHAVPVELRIAIDDVGG